MLLPPLRFTVAPYEEWRLIENQTLWVFGYEATDALGNRTFAPTYLVLSSAMEGPEGPKHVRLAMQISWDRRYK